MIENVGGYFIKVIRKGNLLSKSLSAVLRIKKGKWEI